MTLDQAAKLMGVTKQRVHQLVQSGAIKARWVVKKTDRKMWDIPASELARFQARKKKTWISEE